jgi:hypothetical protein
VGFRLEKGKSNGEREKRGERRREKMSGI